ncbi:ribosome maturation factor RimM [uncultured Helicobacter sp.]|uniref:ribosome maturation factor RimM n=1 Tax=uncultured Helicobacter sp. TaxID=175537 RepID=UPI002629BFD8|nr:ribosome maturation factor RimM [uncultured Helicobacter sp.]
MFGKSVQKDWVSVAKIGRSIGFKGEVFLHLLSDFPESLQSGNVYLSQFGNLTLESYQAKRSIAKFTEIDSKEAAKQIVNLVLYTTQEQCKQQCKLKENEFFWFELVGGEIVENGEILGIVSEIERFCGQDYLFVKTDFALIAQNFPKNFLIPYNARYILGVESKKDSIIHSKKEYKKSTSTDPKIICTQFCKEILENS